MNNYINRRKIFSAIEVEGEVKLFSTTEVKNGEVIVADKKDLKDFKKWQAEKAEEAIHEDISRANKGMAAGSVAVGLGAGSYGLGKWSERINKELLEKSKLRNNKSLEKKVADKVAASKENISKVKKGGKTTALIGAGLLALSAGYKLAKNRKLKKAKPSDKNFSDKEKDKKSKITGSDIALSGLAGLATAGATGYGTKKVGEYMMKEGRDALIKRLDSNDLQGTLPHVKKVIDGFRVVKSAPTAALVSGTVVGGGVLASRAIKRRKAKKAEDKKK